MSDPINMENVFCRLGQAEKDIEKLVLIEALLDGDTNHGSLPYRKLNHEVRRVCDLLDGNESRGVPGLRDQLVDTLDVLKELRDERREAKAQMRGIVIGLGVTGITSVSTLIAILQVIFGGGPPP